MKGYLKLLSTEEIRDFIADVRLELFRKGYFLSYQRDELVIYSEETNYLFKFSDRESELRAWEDVAILSKDLPIIPDPPN